MLYIVLFSIVLLLNFFLSLIVLLKNPKKHINIAFFLFVFSLIAWMVANYLSNQFTDPIFALLFNKLIFIVSPYISFALVYFSLVFPKDTIKINRMNLFYLFIPVLISNLLTGNNLVITEITFLKGGGTGVVFGSGAIFFAIQFLLYLLISLLILFRKYRRSRGYERVQIQYLIFGIGATMLLVVVTNLIIPLVFNNFWFSNIGPFFTLIMIGSISYAIIRHRLLEVRVILARSVMYTLLIVLVAALYTFGVFLVSQYFFHVNVDIRQIVSFAALALFVAFTLIPLRNLVENVTNRIFFKARYNSNTLAFQLTKIIASTISLEELMRKTLQKLLSTLRITHGAFSIYNSRKFTIYSSASSFYEGERKTIDSLYNVKRMIIFDEEKNNKIKEQMRSLDILIIMPLFERGKRLELCCWVRKSPGRYTHIRILQRLRFLGLSSPLPSKTRNHMKQSDSLT